MKSRFVIKVIAIILLILNINIFYTKAIVFDKEQQRVSVLIVADLEHETRWRSDFINSFIKQIESKNEQYDDYSIEIKLENYDNLIEKTKDFKEVFTDYFNTKYSSQTIDMIVTIDNGSFEFIREQIFNEESSLFKKPMVFCGLPKVPILTDEESKYIVSIQKLNADTELLNIISKLQPDVETINIIKDTNKVIDDSINLLFAVGNRDIVNSTGKKLNFIESNRIEDVLNQIKVENSVNIISGSYVNLNNYILSEKDVIKKIKTVTDAPIYTLSEHYLIDGVLGGVVNFAEKKGSMVAKTVYDFFEHRNLNKFSNEIRIYDYVFNYKEIYKNNINPLKIPSDSIIINKRKSDLLIPKSWKFGLVLLLLHLFILVVYNIFIFFKNKLTLKRTKYLNKLATEKEKLKLEFIVNLNHEFRTPINIILSACNLLEYRSRNNLIEQQFILEKLGYIKKNSNRLLKLINNVLDMSKHEEGIKNNILENLNIVEVVENTVLESVDYASNKRIQLTFDTKEEEIVTAIDKNKIERVILNLLSNAIKFTDVDGEIEVTIEKMNQFVIINVRDNGMGIEQSKLEAIFKRFYQAESLMTRSSEGTGIGLYIVKQIIEQHNGSITVESEIGTGSTFIIKLPIVQVENEEIKSTQAGEELKQIVNLEMSDII